MGGEEGGGSGGLRLWRWVAARVMELGALILC